MVKKVYVLLYIIIERCTTYMYGKLSARRNFQLIHGWAYNYGSVECKWDTLY